MASTCFFAYRSIFWKKAFLSLYAASQNAGNVILYTVLLEGESNLFGGKNIKEAKITLKQGSHDVVVKVKYKGGDSTVYIGSLHPIDAVSVERGTPYR